MQNCEELLEYIAAAQCSENYAGIGSRVYMGLRSDLSAPLTETGPNWSGLTFKAGKGLYRLDCREEVNNIVGSSSNQNKGFTQTLNFTLDAVSPTTARVARVLNNRKDLFFCVEDGDEIQIMYHPTNKIQVDSGGIETNTGAAAEDDRGVTCAIQLKKCKYPNNYLTLGDNQTLEGLCVTTDESD